MSFSFFFALPLPLKILFLIGGWLFWTGAKVEHKADARALEVVPADPVKPAAKPAKALIVTVNSDGSYNLDGEKLTGAQLEKKLKALAAGHPGSSVSLKADALTPHQMVESGMKLCRKAGIKNVTFASKAPKP